MTPRDLYMWPARNALPRWTLWMLAAALFVAVEAAWAQTTFEAWYGDAIDGNDAALHGQLLEERRAFQERAAVEPLETLLEELRDEAAALAPSDDPERSRASDSANIQRLVAMLDRLARDIRQARERVEAELRQPATRSDPEPIASNIVNQGPIPNPFGGMGQVTAGPNAGAYVIAEGAAEEIIVPPRLDEHRRSRDLAHRRDRRGDHRHREFAADGGNTLRHRRGSRPVAPVHG